MKSSFFQKPLEFSLETCGESWSQGDLLKGSLTIKNHGNEEVDLSLVGVTLALTDARKFKAKNIKAFKIDRQIPFPKETKLAASGEETLEWEFLLDSDCPITEKSSALHVYCGEQDNLFGGGQLELQINPIQTLTKYIEIFENFYRFKSKSMKNKGGFIEVVYKCPGGRDLDQIEKLTQRLRIIKGNLEVNWDFKINRLSYDTGSVIENLEDQSYQQSLLPKQYKMFGDSPNQDGIISSIDEVIDQAKKKNIF